MRFVLFAVLILFCISTSTFAEKIAEIREVFQYPILAAVDNEKIFIYDGRAVSIHIYSRKDYRLLGKFGGQGEGPSEFKFIHHIRVFPGYIFISSGGKISYFSPTGEVQKEIKTPYAFSTFFPMGRNFVCKQYGGESDKQTITVKLMDSSLKEKKEVESFEYETRSGLSKGKMNFVVIRDYFGYVVEDDRLYVGNTKKGFHFSVYDENGDIKYQIDRAYQKRPITEKDKAEYMRSFSEQVGKVRFERAKEKYNYLYPDFFPAYSNMTVSAGNIYVLTYPRENDQQTLEVLDKKGNFLKKMIVYTQSDSGVLCVYNGTYYYLKVNNDTEVLELHAINLQN